MSKNNVSTEHAESSANPVLHGFKLFKFAVAANSYFAAKFVCRAAQITGIAIAHASSKFHINQLKQEL